MKAKPNDLEFLWLIKGLVQVLQPKVYVELGLGNGGTFNVIAPMVDYAYGVDLVIKSQVVGRGRLGGMKFEGPSNLFADDVKNWNGAATIDLLFIDAEHGKGSVLQDFNNFAPYVTEGTGIILLHDTHPAEEELLASDFCSNAWEAAWEIRKDPKYQDFEIVTLPGNWAGISIIRKAKKHLSWDPNKGTHPLNDLNHDGTWRFKEEVPLPLTETPSPLRGIGAKVIDFEAYSTSDPPEDNRKEANPKIYPFHRPKKAKKSK